MLLFTLMLPGRAALDFHVLDSAKPGPTLVVVAPEKGAGTDVLRQLQNAKTDRGRLVLARPAAETGDWESEPEFATLAARFGDAQILVFREDEEAHLYDKHFRGDTVQGSGEAASAVLAALRGLPSDIAGKDWLALPAKAADRKIIVTTNARVDMEVGLRPAVREREFRTSATAMLRHLKMTEADGLALFPATRRGLIRVAVYDGPGAVNSGGRGPAWLRARLSREAGMIAELVGPKEILSGVLDRADVILIGGGKVTQQIQALGKEGREAVARFVREGGGYLGICAGAYLASNRSGKWDYLELLPVETRGTDLSCHTPLVWKACSLGDARVENADLNGGPMFQLMESGVESLSVLATFQRNESSTWRGQFALEGTPAVISGMYGKGRVILASTHCERPPSPANLFPGMIRWIASHDDH